VRTWRRRGDPPTPLARWNPSSASTTRGRPRYLRKRRYLGVEPKKYRKVYVYDKEQFRWIRRGGRRGKKGIKK
jgi:hypothetical protein